jgi:hypothetical protein
MWYSWQVVDGCDVLLSLQGCACLLISHVGVYLHISHRLGSLVVLYGVVLYMPLLVAWWHTWACMTIKPHDTPRTHFPLHCDVIAVLGVHV